MIRCGFFEEMPSDYQSSLTHGLVRTGWKLALADAHQPFGPDSCFVPLLTWHNEYLARLFFPDSDAHYRLGRWTWTDMDTTGPLTVFGDVADCAEFAFGYERSPLEGALLRHNRAVLAVLRVRYVPVEPTLHLWITGRSNKEISTLNFPLPKGTRFAGAVEVLGATSYERLAGLRPALEDVYGTVWTPGGDGV